MSRAVTTWDQGRGATASASKTNACLRHWSRGVAGESALVHAPAFDALAPLGLRASGCADGVPDWLRAA